MRVAADPRAGAGGRSRLRLSWVIWAAGQLASFETAFVLFIFASAYTAHPRFAWFPGNMTLVFFGLSIVAGMILLLRGRLYLPGVQLVCAAGILVLWIAVSRIWSPSDIYANEKLIAVIGGNLWCLTATAVIISSSRTRVWRFLVLLLIFGVALAVNYTIDSDIAAQTPGVEQTFTNYLLIGRLCGLAALVAFAFWLWSPPRSARRLVLLAAFGLCGYVLLKAGGRNPAAAIPISMLVPLLPSLGGSRGQLGISRRSLASLGLIAALALVVTSLVISGESSLRTLQRFDVLVSRAESGEEANPRFDLWRHAVAYWAERPIVGHGVGAWPILYLERDIRHYPHNLILELLVEFGLIGLALFAVFALLAARRVSLQRLRVDPAFMCAVMLCINAFVNAMTTGDISDNRNLFTVLGLLAMRPPNKGY